MNILQKIQNLPEGKRKIILWGTVIIIGIALFFFWTKNAKKSFTNFDMGEFQKQLNFPKIEIPKFDLPDLDFPDLDLPSADLLKDLPENIELPNVEIPTTTNEE
ncbi:MAG: hypothetical protein A2175_01840 [Candidatus Nealsonbacteria bacterium RBG_13_42_11]|uniref:Uncharacterized protein n=1 Tax=Candidatus Nealsonbacteria bacterium RBG_13_42_11 TaxID=1801663 RepID=A0A1G2DZS0_9BACT|nr:MAG: hypothetical protein A2175_01840 [Candidatus Nealsonbacteria bacterium RBG_13_42_11]